jgi:hypothetical protein
MHRFIWHLLLEVTEHRANDRHGDWFRENRVGTLRVFHYERVVHIGASTTATLFGGSEVGDIKSLV